ncbi:hypothetical protein, partial [Acetobacterium fimetarium]|uniref:hypothetical protein n=1 Tax=Acetobacterium fimetarium TaxID=52691 RepID=UPI001A9B815A
ILDTSCILWIFTNWLVSNNLNLLEVFFIVNPLTYLNYTGSFLIINKKFWDLHHQTKIIE